MKIPAIPSLQGVNPETARLMAPVKERLEQLQGARGASFARLPVSASEDALYARVDDIVGRMQGDWPVRSVTEASLPQFARQRGGVVGCLLTYNSSAQVGLTVGAAYINGAVVAVQTALTMDVGTLATGTLYYVYLTSAGVLEKSTTAPVKDNALNYWKKPGDANRRCVGYILTDGAAAMFPFVMTGADRTRDIVLAADPVFALDNVLAGGVAGATSTTWTAVNASAYRPANAQALYVKGFILNNGAGTENGILGVSGMNLTGRDPSAGEFMAFVGGPTFATVGAAGWVPCPSTSLYWATYGDVQADCAGTFGVSGARVEI